MRPFLLLLLLFGGIYALLLLFLYFYQDRLVYFPSRRLWATPERINLEFEDVTMGVDEDTLHAWFAPADSGAPVVLFCHGNAGNIADRMDMVKWMHQVGLSVLIFDYRGYGRSTGRPSEQATYADAEAAYQWLRQRGYHDSDIVLFGKSLGASVAAYLAQDRPVRALVLESAFASLTDVAAVHYPWVPVRWILKYRYPTTDYVKRMLAPVTVIHSREDEIAPLAQGQEVYDAAPEPKRFIEVGGGHNMYPETPWIEILSLDTSGTSDNPAD